MKLLRYLIVGGASAVVDIGLFYLFAITFSWNYLLVGAGAFLIATTVNYYLSVRHVFQSGSRFGRRAEVAAVFAVSAVGLLLNQMVLYAGIEYADFHKLLAKLLATGTVFFWNYTVRANYIFVRR